MMSNTMPSRINSIRIRIAIAIPAPDSKVPETRLSAAESEIAMKNVGFKFENLLADAGYSNELVIDYLQKSQIEGFIPNAI